MRSIFLRLWAVQISTPAGSLLLRSSALQLRGERAVRLPLTSRCGDVLLFNGEIFGGLHVPSDGNDGEALLDALSAADGHAIPDVLSALRGPWALVFWHAASTTLWFGRDVVGEGVGASGAGKDWHTDHGLLWVNGFMELWCFFGP